MVFCPTTTPPEQNAHHPTCDSGNVIGDSPSKFLLLCLPLASAPSQNESAPTITTSKKSQDMINGRSKRDAHEIQNYHLNLDINRNIFREFTSFRWNIPAASAADALVFSNTSEKCSTVPAPLLAITGMLTASETSFTKSISNPFP